MYPITFLLIIIFPTIIFAQGTDSIYTNKSDSLIELSRSLIANKEYEQAMKINDTSLALALDILGKESIDYGIACFLRGKMLHIKNDLAGAKLWYIESKNAFENNRGNENIDYADCLNNLGVIYFINDQYEQAENSHLESLTIWEKLKGKDNLDYAASLNNLAVLYRRTGQYEKAEQINIESLNIKKNVLGEDHLEYAKGLLNLGNLYNSLYYYEKAESLYLDANKILLKNINKEHIDYTTNLVAMGALYENLGQYEKAELLYLESKDILEKISETNHPRYAETLNNLAVLYLELNNFEKAELYFKIALEIKEKFFGNNSTSLATSISNLANLYRSTENFNEAELLHLKALEIREITLGENHPDYAASLNNLANLYTDIGEYNKAESLYIESIAIREKSLGKSHPDYIMNLSNLAAFYSKNGNYEKAENLYLEAKELCTNFLGITHPIYVNILSNLSYLFEKQERFFESSVLMAEYLPLERNKCLNAVNYLSQSELLDYTNIFQNHDSKINGLFILRPQDQFYNLPELSFDNALFYKGFLLNSIVHLNNIYKDIPELTNTINELKGYSRRIAAELIKPISKQKGLETLQEQVNILEKELARSISDYPNTLQQVSWQNLQATLSGKETVLEFINFVDPSLDKKNNINYGVLILNSELKQPKFIHLFDESQLDHLIGSDSERKADYVNDLYAWADRGMVKLGSEKKSLYDLIWAKIEATGLEGIKTVYYSPSGVLHRLNLGAIAVDDETILSDRYQLIALNSTRQLVIPTTVTLQTNDALLVGGVNFEADTLLATPEVQPLLVSRSTADAWTESGTRGGKWSYLKWTEKEVANITTTLAEGGFKTTQLTGSEATEEAIKTIGTVDPSPRILHIATHGFFFPDPELAPSFRRGLGEVEPVFKNSDNPMIRSGLILAGGNYAWQHGRSVSPDKEDGILTAYEISQMNLANTELVVLSACETGLGDIQGNEGVYGLQRTFKIAGAKYLIMSLWQVPDRETMEFMTTFYTNWLDGKMTIPDAFRKTQIEMRDRFYNPYSWAGFVLVE